jgi:hypothetical protein
MSNRPRLGGMLDDPYDPGADRLPNRAFWWRGTGSPDRRATGALMLLRWMAALFVVLALAGCAEGTTGQAGAPDWPSSPERQDRNVPEHGGGDGGGGGGGM